MFKICTYFLDTVSEAQTALAMMHDTFVVPHLLQQLLEDFLAV